MKGVPRRAACWGLGAMVLAAGCGSTGSPTAPGQVVTRRVVVVGDSLAVSPTPNDNFPAMLQTYIDRARLPWSVANAGVSGATSAEGLQRIEPLLTGDVGVVILELGANDGLQGIDIGTIDRNLATMVELAQSRSMHVLLCGMETPPTHGLDYSIAFHSVFPALAQRYRLTLVPFLLAGIAFNPEFTGADGVHPNAAGAQRIAAIVWPYLEPLLRAAPCCPASG